MADIRIKHKLRDGKAVTVLAGMHDADLIDFMGTLGFEAVWIECEHGPVDWSEIGDQTRAADLWNMASIVRVMANEPWLITRTLDRGASGICVPHISTKAEAERVVEAAKFGPIGLRGMFGSRRSYGQTDQYNKANEETFVVVLIEEKEAVDNLAEILTVDHIDVFFVAPSDLAQTLGYTGQPGHPEVRKVIDGAIRQIVAAGRTAGALVTDETMAHYHGLGARFFNVNWRTWLERGARDFRSKLDTLNAG